MERDIFDEIVESGDMENRYEGRERLVNAKVNLLRALTAMPMEALLDEEVVMAVRLFRDKDVNAVLNREKGTEGCDDTGLCPKHGWMALGNGYCPECKGNLI